MEDVLRFQAITALKKLARSEAALFDGTLRRCETADPVESRHDCVKRTIERLAESGVIALPPLVEVSNHGPGPNEMMVYVIGKRDSYVIVAQLSPEMTARQLDRWHAQLPTMCQGRSKSTKSINFQ